MFVFADFIKSRHSKRAFLSTPVSQKTIEMVLSTAQSCPSSKNMQCWKIAVVSGLKRDELSAELCAAFDSGVAGKLEYCYMSQKDYVKFKGRAKKCGKGLFALKGININSKTERVAHNRENYTFFNAPAVMIIHLPISAQPGMFLDTGIFVQNIMLSLKAFGLDSCPQISLATYPQQVRKILNLDSSRLIVCGLSFGYADRHARVNAYVPEREPLNQIVDWFY